MVAAIVGDVNADEVIRWRKYFGRMPALSHSITVEDAEPKTVRERRIKNCRTNAPFICILPTTNRSDTRTTLFWRNNG